MEEEKVTEKIPITVKENYKQWKIDHIAVKSKKCIIIQNENEETKEWENIRYDINSNKSRFLYSDKIEEITKDSEEETSILRNDEDSEVKIYQHFNNIKIYKNDKLVNSNKIKTFKETRTITKDEIITKKKPYRNGLEYDEVKIQRKIIKEYDNGKKNDVIEGTIGKPIKRFWKTITNTKKFDDIVGDITFHKIKIEKREYETDNNGNLKNKEDKGKPIDENDDIVSYTVKEVTTNSHIRKMLWPDIQREYPELYDKYRLRNIFLMIGTFSILYLLKCDVKITETKEYEKTYDYKTKKLIETREVSTRSTQEILA